MKFNIELLGSSFYYTINRISMKLFEVLSLWLLVLLLPKEEIGLIGITVGFISVLNLLNLSPYRRIFKSFTELKGRMNDHVSSYIWFWFLASALMLAVALITGYLYITNGFPWELFIVLNGLVLAYLFNNLQLLLQEVFFVNLKQKTATYFNIASMAIFLLSLALLLMFPSIEIYIGLVVLKAILTPLGLFFLAGREINFSFALPRDAQQLIRDAIKEFAIYDHLIGAAIELINKVFLFTLGFFVAQSIVGDYTIALALVNFLTFFPLIIYRTTMLAITRVSGRDGLEKVLSAFTKYAVIFSVLQFLVFLLFLGPVLDFVTDDPGSVWLYAVLLGLGVTIFTAAYPIHATALLRGNIRGYFTKIVLPITVLALLGYTVASAYFTPETVGIVFIAAAIAINALAYIHVKDKANVSIQTTFIYPEEKEAIDHILRKIGLKSM